MFLLQRQYCDYLWSLHFPKSFPIKGFYDERIAVGLKRAGERNIIVAKARIPLEDHSCSMLLLDNSKLTRDLCKLILLMNIEMYKQSPPLW